MVEPIAGCDHPSVFGTFLRELDEEMFGGPEADEYLENLKAKEHIKELSGELAYLGHGIDLMRHEVALLLLFRPDKDWWKKFGWKMKLNWEYQSGAARREKIGQAADNARKRPTDYVPAAYAALQTASRII